MTGSTTKQHKLRTNTIIKTKTRSTHTEHKDNGHRTNNTKGQGTKKKNNNKHETINQTQRTISRTKKLQTRRTTRSNIEK